VAVSTGYIFVIVFIALAVATVFLVVCFRKHARRLVTHFAIFVRAPQSFARVVGDRVVTSPSIIHGLLSILVVIGVILVTIYQIENFVQNRYSTITTIQAGTAFTNGKAIVSAQTFVSVSVTLVASAMNCSAIKCVASLGAISLPAPVCSQSPTGLNTTFVFGLGSNSSFPSSTTALTLLLTSTSGGIVFTPTLAYTLNATMYNNDIFKLEETLAGVVLTGSSVVEISSVACESIDIDGNTLDTGFLFSYLDNAPSVSSNAGFELSLSFVFTIPQYFQQTRQIESISILVFLSSILAIAGGVISVGGLSVFGYAYVKDHFLQDQNSKSLNMQLLPVDTPYGPLKDDKNGNGEVF